MMDREFGISLQNGRHVPGLVQSLSYHWYNILFTNDTSIYNLLKHVYTRIKV